MSRTIVIALLLISVTHVLPAQPEVAGNRQLS